METSVAGQTVPLKPASAAVLHTPPAGSAVTISHASSELLQKLVAAGPRKIAPRADIKTTQYVSASQGSVPISVVSQLIAAKGTNVPSGKKSILLIPVEKDSQGKAVTPSSVVQTMVTPTKTPVSHDQTGSQVSPGAELSVSPAPGSKSPNQPILPKPQVMAGIQRLPLQQGILGLQGAVVTQGVLQHRVLGGLNGSLNKLAHNTSTSPPRYPSNETVRTLLDKRKSTEDKNPPYKYMKLYLGTTTAASSITTSVSPPINATSLSTTVKMTTETSLATKKTVNTPNKTFQVVMPVQSVPSSTEKEESTLALGKVQQCVITSLSPAKLNTLLLQTSAAGAKSIPSLIKLPSQAALDSAVKAVVTSVNTTLPTVNIKVPSPTSLPNIGPRRNVTKTIQTMKSPIPVAPKVVTQSSGGRTNLSMANSATVSGSQLLVMSSMQGQAVQGGQVIQGQSGIMQVQGSVGHSAGTLMQAQGIGLNSGMVALQGKTTLIPAGVASLQGQGALNQSGVSGVSGTGVVSVGPGSQVVGSSTATRPQVTVAVPGQSNVNGKNDSKKLVTKLTPHLLITSKGVMQVGYMSQENPANKTAADLPVVTTHHDTTPHSQMVSQTDKTKPVIALNASGVPIGSIRRTSVGQSVSTVTTNSSGTPRPQLVQSYVMPQPATSLVNPVQSPVLAQPNIMSPLIGVNLQTGLALPGGVQLASPLGLQLLQSPLAAAIQTQQNSGLLAVANQTMAQQLANPNVKLNTPTMELLQKQVVKTTVQTVTPTNLLVTTSPLQMLTSSSSLQASARQMNLTSPLTVGNKQLVFQYPSAGQQLAAVTSQFLQAQLSSAATSKATPVKPENLARPVVVSTPAQPSHSLTGMAQNISSTPPSAAVNVHHIQVPANASSKPNATSQQQKLLLFSIGGQLVTGQGVPVTLSNGVLKVLPQAKVKINNQTLTQEQVKQTLAKINEASTLSASKPVSTTQTNTVQASLSVTTSVSCASVASAKQSVTSSFVCCNVSSACQSATSTNVSSATGCKVSGSENAEHVFVSENTKKTLVKKLSNIPVSKSANTSLHNGQRLSSQDHNYLVTPKPYWKGGRSVTVSLDENKKLVTLNQDIVTKSNPQDTLGVTEVMFDHNNMPVKIENHSCVEEKVVKEEQPSSNSVSLTKQHQLMIGAPILRADGRSIGKLVLNEERGDKSYVVKAPVKTDGRGDATSVTDVKSEVKTEFTDEDEAEEHKLVIDDQSGTDKEAALNLLTLANQALNPPKIKVEKNI